MALGLAALIVAWSRIDPIIEQIHISSDRRQAPRRSDTVTHGERALRRRRCAEPQPSTSPPRAPSSRPTTAHRIDFSDPRQTSRSTSGAWVTPPTDAGGLARDADILDLIGRSCCPRTTTIEFHTDDGCASISSAAPLQGDARRRTDAGRKASIQARGLRDPRRRRRASLSPATRGRRPGAAGLGDAMIAPPPGPAAGAHRPCRNCRRGGAAAARCKRIGGDKGEHRRPGERRRIQTADRDRRRAGHRMAARREALHRARQCARRSAATRRSTPIRLPPITATRPPEADRNLAHRSRRQRAACTRRAETATATTPSTTRHRACWWSPAATWASTPTRRSSPRATASNTQDGPDRRRARQRAGGSKATTAGARRHSDRPLRAPGRRQAGAGSRWKPTAHVASHKTADTYRAAANEGDYDLTTEHRDPDRRGEGHARQPAQRRVTPRST